MHLFCVLSVKTSVIKSDKINEFLTREIILFYTLVLVHIYYF